MEARARTRGNIALYADYRLERPISHALSQQLVVFTDLDGTLLDHDTYDWQPAAPAISALKAHAIPVVLISSKTLDELAVWRRDIDLPDPVVAENGAAIDLPDGYFAESSAATLVETSRASIQNVLATLRKEQGVRCRAFFELGAEGIAAATGLSVAQAELANRRRASEPLLWQDDDAALEKFAAAAAAHGLRCVRGGRFVHLMAQTDKANAMARLLDLYAARWPDKTIVSVALGDSPNDLAMLRAADTAVVIPARRPAPMDLSDHAHVLRPDLPGPSGWQLAMSSILSSLSISVDTGSNHRG